MKGFSSILNRIKVYYYRIFADKRKYPRVNISVKVTDKNSGTFTYYQAANISEGGIFLKAEAPLPEGTSLKLKFSLPEMEEVEVEAQVVRVQAADPDQGRSSGMGIKFTKTSRQADRAIKSFVKMKM